MASIDIYFRIKPMHAFSFYSWSAADVYRNVYCCLIVQTHLTFLMAKDIQELFLAIIV